MKPILSYLFLVYFGICVTCLSFKSIPLPSTTIFFYNGNYDEQVEVMRGAVKSISIGDSLSAADYYHVDFDRKGNMVRSFEKDKFYGDIYHISARYKVLHNKKGIKTAMTASYNISPAGICDCFGRSAKWRFDQSGQIIEFVPKRRSGYTEYEYNALGRVLYQKTWGKLDVPEISKYRYDENNRLVELQNYEPEWESGDYEGGGRVKELHERVAFDYPAFDTHLNWTKKQMRFLSTRPNGESYTERTRTITRKITYY